MCAFVVLVLLMACGGESKETAGVLLPDYKTFSYRSDDVSQTLQLNWESDTTISFVLAHHQGDCHYILSGDAMNTFQAYGPESDVDEETGEVYAIDLFLYNLSHCRMAIRIAQDTSRVQLQVAHCAASPSCAIESVGVLRRE